ncbi:putative patatin-like serine [Phaeomoniella chlamydospora]|uniref:Patatin-like phospholipase domain-containing protein n=1 Tax=Phaeomoniella chlamydospora TaxID=158046 RepID=A0A0G2EHN4_PHACM|nr:putative patatin-like serine [Phaeomoniella chlamydospora]
MTDANPDNKSLPLRSNYDPFSLPDFDHEFVTEEDLEEFRKALYAPEATPVTALNDWRPVHQRVRKSRVRRKTLKRSKDETREGVLYTILKWPLLFVVFGWILILSVLYALTRIYISSYEHFVTWTGRREKLRKRLQYSRSYDEWSEAANELDNYLGNEDWKQEAEYAYYDYKTVRKVTAQLGELRAKVQQEESNRSNGIGGLRPIDELKSLLENCVKNNFVGVENPRLYSETYIGTKFLAQGFVDEAQRCLQTVLNSPLITENEKKNFFKHLDTNYGRTALCLSGGATFAYYHFGVIKALLETGNLPEIITGTSGGALVAALVGTRTDDELKQLLVPALAYRIQACAEPMSVWIKRWWKTGARFDSVTWAKHCSWFCRGSMTFREAYERTGRILNVSCIPSDPHSPTILANYLTSPDCVIWTAVLASAAVPGILNPIVLMRKTRDGTLAPYSFGHKWKDGSLRTDIPLKSLNLHFNVNFSIVSQVNPHINLFFFSSRGTVGRPVTHRRGRGWRGGFLGSALETTLKLDLQKYLKILRHLELLPRPLGQDWSEIWLQRFSGTITVWPKTQISDFWNILSDPNTKRLARMLRVGENSAWPKIRFVNNRMKIEKIIVEGLRTAQSRLGEPARQDPNSFHNDFQAREGLGNGRTRSQTPALANGFSLHAHDTYPHHRRSSTMLEELRRQTTVFFDDSHDEDARSHTDGATTEDESEGRTGDEEEEDILADEEEDILADEEEGTRIG